MPGHLQQIVACVLFALAEASYPLAPLATPLACTCSGGGDGLGWSYVLDRCMEGEVTSCLECPVLSKCASISNVAGNGIQLFYGDCRTATQECAAADASSIAFAVSLAVDEMDNIYFSDQGNNRIRMLDKSRNALVTIAGTGELGFQGDGGPARLAQLRKPEGLALKPGLDVGPDNVGRELYFADFVNQRIRKLVRTSTEWVIYTVAGNGGMADDPLCDSGCPALETSLWNPRSLAFASNQDLYFVDSGSRKIRRLTTSLGDPLNNPNASVTTFLGNSEWTSTHGMWESFRGIAKVTLPGHFVSRNEHLHLRAMYAILIDKHDRLWTIDSDNNRIFMAPLVNRSITRLAGDFGNFLARMAMSSFKDNSTQANTTAEDRQSMELTWANNLKTWLPLEFPELASASSVQVESSVSPHQVGYSYWMYGAPVAHETWCPTRQVEKPDLGCEENSAQLARFNGLMGMCLDHASNMYLVDTEDSQVMLMDTDEFKDSISSADASTASGCFCEQYWVGLEESNSGEFFLPGAWISTDYQLDILRCRENPLLQSILEASPTPVLNLTEALAQQPACSTTDYCGRVFSDTYPKWCYANTRSMPDGSQRDMCEGNRWLWCDSDVQDNAETSWKFVPEATIIGNAKRFETRYWLDVLGVQSVMSYLTSDLWLTAGSPYEYVPNLLSRRPANFFLRGTAILKGFVDFGNGPCNETCCGLPMPSTVQNGDTTGHVCAFTSLDNVSILESYYPAPTNQTGPGGGPGPGPIVTMLTVWEELESLVFNSRESAGLTSTATARSTLEFCKSRCQFDSTCSGFMVKGVDEETPELLSQGQPCIFFTHNYPFYVYTIDRTVAPFDTNGDANLSNPTDRAAALNAFVGPGVPASRMTGDQNGIYVASEGSLLYSQDTIQGGNMNKALLLMDCQELCLQEPDCTGIAFPGCYLLKKVGIQLLSDSDMTSLYIKEKMRPGLQPVAGYSEADAYAEEADRALESYLNKPYSCAVDSKGDLLISDGLNQRLRKVQGYNTQCSTNEQFTVQQVQDFELRIAAADAACNNASAPELVAIYAAAQADVVENGNVQLVQDQFCNFGSSPKLAEMAGYTTNLFVLCQVCQELNPRPVACPVDDTAETARTFENFGLNFEVTDLFGFMQDSKEDGSSEEYNIYGDSDNDERLAKRQQEAQDIIAKEKERMDGGAFLRMRRGAAPGGGARERAARKRGKKDAAKVKEEPVKQASQEPEPPRSEPEPSTFNFGFNFGMPEVLNFGGQDAEEISEEHYIYDESDTEAQLERRRAEAKDILALEQERTAGAVSRMRRGVAPAPAGGGARERAAKKKNKKLAGTAMMTASQGLEEA
ncbi:SOQ1 [Symbiodinium sp. KB8]|nr:SOQ1 [Symbiodinium sp. KB8]